MLHNCRHADTDDGLPFNCDCQSYVTYNSALEKLSIGLARWKRLQKHGGGFIDNMREIVICGRQPMCPRAQTIERSHIERAYVDGKIQEQARIEAYGQINQAALAELGAGEGLELRQREAISPANIITMPEDGSVIPQWNDQRSSVGKKARPN